MRPLRRNVVAAGVADVTSGVDGAGSASRRLLSRRWQKVVAIIAVALVAFGAATARLLIWPVQGAPSQVSAIVLFAGPGDRLTVALGLARAHRAPVLVVSQGHLGYGGPCPPPTPGVRTICFDPNPADTRGEAEYVGQLAKRYGWRSLILVVTPTQAVRAQLLMGRCFSGPTYVITAQFPRGNWPYQLAYGWGALVKALVTSTNC